MSKLFLICQALNPVVVKTGDFTNASGERVFEFCKLFVIWLLFFWCLIRSKKFKALGAKFCLITFSYFAM
jgi:hypothetical protein